MRSYRAVAAIAVLVLGVACEKSDKKDNPPPAQHTLRVFAWGGGTVTPAPGVYTYDEGTVVTLTAAPADGATFTGWSGAASGATTTTTVTVDGDLLVGARFFNPALASTLPVPLTGPVAEPSGTPGNLQVLNWAGFEAAVSYTLDDARVSVPAGDNYATLTAPGVPMTFFISPREAQKHLEFWQGVVEDGQEIGNHTEDHCMVNADGTLVLTPGAGEQGCAYTYGVSETTQDAMDEIDAANTYIQDVLGQDGVFSFASPYGDGDWAQFARAAGLLMHRNVWSSFNSDDPFVPALDLTNQYNVPGPWFGPVIEPGQTGTWGELGDTAEVIDDVIDQVRDGGGWSAFLFHRVTPAPDDASDGCCAVPAAEIASSMTYLQELGDVWGGTVGDVAAYWIGQKLLADATPVVSGDTTTWTWTLPPNFPPGKFVRVTVDGGTLSQGGVDLVWDEHGYYEVALDAGELTLGAAAAPTASALKITASTASNAYGDWGVVVTFPIEAPGVDLSTGDWTATADYYIPGAYGYPIFKSFAYQFSNGGTPDWSQASATTYSGYATDGWQTLSFPLNSGFGALTAAKQFRIRFSTSFSNPPDPADGTPVVFYLRNIKLSNGTTTALDIPVTTTTSTGVGSVSLGTGSITIEMP